MFRRLLLLYGLTVFASVALLTLFTFGEVPWYRSLLIALLAGLTASLPGLLIERWIARPLRDLTEAARHIMAGDYTSKVYAAGGGELGALARTFNDMSDQLAAQFAQVQEDRKQLRTILGGLVEGVIAIDEQQKLLFANEKASALLEFHPKTAIGRKFWEVVRQKSILALVERSLASGQPASEALDWKNNVKSMQLSVVPLEAGYGAIVVLHDTTELRRLERLRHEFVANVSHELKTPLAVVKANVDTLLGGAIDDLAMRTTFLEQINEQAERLHNLILDLLSLARIESGNQVLNIERVVVGELVDDCLDRHRPRAAARNQQLEAIPPAEPSSAEIRTDAESLSHILDNLIDNAVKYANNGSHIRVHWYGCGDQLCLEISDDGPGIPAEDLPRIFERFYRVDKARSRELGGTGLGLAIVKNLAQILKGSVNVTSEYGRGAMFIVCLPRAPS
ncbi:MAG: ATP-binding protein [Gemmataceae bacterium]